MKRSSAGAPSAARPLGAQHLRRAPVAGQPAAVGGQQDDVGGDPGRQQVLLGLDGVAAAGDRHRDQRRRAVELRRRLGPGRGLEPRERLRAEDPEAPGVGEVVVRRPAPELEELGERRAVNGLRGVGLVRAAGADRLLEVHPHPAYSRVPPLAGGAGDGAAGLVLAACRPASAGTAGRRGARAAGDAKPVTGDRQRVDHAADVAVLAAQVVRAADALVGDRASTVWTTIVVDARGGLDLVRSGRWRSPGRRSRRSRWCPSPRRSGTWRAARSCRRRRTRPSPAGRRCSQAARRRPARPGRRRRPERPRR